MKQVFVYILALIGGISIGIEAALSGALAETVGRLESSLYIFVMGALSLLLVVLFWGRGNIAILFKNPKWKLSGGVIGVFYLALLVTSVTLVGVGVSMTVVIVGQLLASIIIDHFGWLGTEKRPIRKNRIIAIVLLFSSLFFIL